MRSRGRKSQRETRPRQKKTNQLPVVPILGLNLAGKESECSWMLNSASCKICTAFSIPLALFERKKGHCRGPDNPGALSEHRGLHNGWFELTQVCRLLRNRL